MNEKGAAGNASELERGMATLEYIKGQIEMLKGQRATLSSIIIEYERSLEVVEAVTAGINENVMIPLGGTVFMKAKISGEGKLIMDQGAGVFMELDAEEARERIEERKGKIQGSASAIDRNIEELYKRYNEIASKTQELYNSQMAAGAGPEQTF